MAGKIRFGEGALERNTGVILRLVLLLVWMALSILAELNWYSIPGWGGVVMNLIFLPGFALFLAVTFWLNDDMYSLDAINDHVALKSLYSTSALLFFPVYAICVFGIVGYLYLWSLIHRRSEARYGRLRSKLSGLLAAETESPDYRHAAVRVDCDPEYLKRIRVESALPPETVDVIDEYLEVDKRRSRLKSEDR